MKTEPIGSIPRPLPLLHAIAAFRSQRITRNVLDEEYAKALRDTLQRFAETGSPVITDGEQTKPSFATYPISGIKDLSPNGVVIPFADGHTRQFPAITSGPFHYTASVSYTH